MAHYIVAIDFGDDEQERTYLVEAPNEVFAKFAARDHARGLVNARILSEPDDLTDLSEDIDGELHYP